MSRQTDPLDDLTRQIERSVAQFRRRMRDDEVPMGSRTLGFAVAAGFPVQMSYTTAEMAAITGLDFQMLNAERKAGRLAATFPPGKEKGYRIRVDEMDRWFEENTRRSVA